METLYEFFEKNPKVALAFSGGVDSSYLLYAAVNAGVDVCAYYAKSDFQPEFEFEDAKRLATELGAEMKIIYLDVLADPVVEANPADRCYYCKKHIFRAIIDRAKKDGYEVIMDGTNASDDPGDRPGVRALREYGVRSPLRDCGLTKTAIRELSKEAGLFTWDKPAYACLATRIQTDQKILYKTLKAVEASEGFMAE
ncbi:MAG: ATP-dependent sacrificial sulfur transferase LarE, partial [Firmicutes bacterium]|nr:ATP-dependent sacrificial sulfur transferase LarE [Bacillota bacterium]